MGFIAHLVYDIKPVFIGQFQILIHRRIVRGTYGIEIKLFQQFKILAAASSLDKEVAEAAAGKNKCEVAALVGKLAAQRAVEKGISTVAFDRNGYLYHGRVKVLADAAREGGLKF